jgi:E1-E2 ATPase/haloacid dehalogenase-like hydrolase
VAIAIRATARVEDSQYQRIVALVEEASRSRAPLVRLADRYAVPFTAVSLLIAGVAWLVSGDPVRFAEVLVLATPCPLLIAAPVAFMGGMSRAARDGVIVKGGGTLEQLARTRTVAFDKTGTLTYGQPALDAVNSVPPLTANELLALAASAERYSSHVLAASVLAAAEARGLSLQKAATAEEHATHGVLAELPEGTVAVGKCRFVSENAAGVEPATLHSGQRAIYVSVAGRFAGTIVCRISYAATQVRRRSDHDRRHFPGGAGGRDRSTHPADSAAEHLDRNCAKCCADGHWRVRLHPGHRWCSNPGGGGSAHNSECAPGPICRSRRASQAQGSAKKTDRSSIRQGRLESRCARGVPPVVVPERSMAEHVDSRIASTSRRASCTDGAVVNPRSLPGPRPLDHDHLPVRTLGPQKP